jgi:hypothetical protein
VTEQGVAGRLCHRHIDVEAVVVAFDPEQNEPELLRTVVQLLRAAALAASARSGDAEVSTATEDIAAATAQLSVIDKHQ